jgi:integrase
VPKLTKRFVDSVKPKRNNERIEWDSDLKGFGLRVTATGSKSFIFKYRAGHGRNAPIKKPTIGKFGEVTVEEARKIAKNWSAIITQGGDPGKARQDEAEAPTLQRLFDDYFERHCKPHKRERSWKQDKAMFNQHAPDRLKRKKVADVVTRDIEDIHRRLKDTPYMGNRVLALLSKMFNLALKWEWRETNPCKGIARYQEHKRERMMTPDELKTFLKALEDYEKTAEIKTLARMTTNAFRLLLLTGARRSEVLSARWEEIDFSAGVWTKPSSHTKQKKVHRIPLSGPAIELLTTMQEEADEGGEYLFPARRGNGDHISDPRQSWSTIKKEAGLEDFRIHDLRHSFASFLASSGQSLIVIGALLGHTQPATTARYAHLLDDPLRAATDRVGALVENISDDEKVVSIKKRKNHVL